MFGLVKEVHFPNTQINIYVADSQALCFESACFDAQTASWRFFG
jgi:hypothetical protein